MDIETNCKPPDILIYCRLHRWLSLWICLAGGSLLSKTVELCSKIVVPTVTTSPSDHGDRGSHTGSSMAASQSDTKITHAITLRLNLFQKVEFGMACRDWHIAVHSHWLQRLLLMYCLGHAGVRRNVTCRLASSADITTSLQLGKTEILKRLGELFEHRQTRALWH